MRLARNLYRLSTRAAAKHSGMASLLLRASHFKSASSAARSLAGFVLHHHAVTAPSKVRAAAGIRYFQNNADVSKKRAEEIRIQQLVKQLNTTATDLKGTLEIALFSKGELALLHASLDSIQDLKNSHTMENLLAQLAAVNAFLKDLNDPSKQKALTQLVEDYKTKTPLLYDLIVPKENLTGDFKM